MELGQLEVLNARESRRVGPVSTRPVLSVHCAMCARVGAINVINLDNLFPTSVSDLKASTSRILDDRVFRKGSALLNLK